MELTISRLQSDALAMLVRLCFASCDVIILFLHPGYLISEEESSEGELSPTNSIVNKTISRVICRQLFNPASPDRDLSHGDHDDTMLTKPVPEADPLPNSSCGTVVTTPDSGCGTAEDDSSAYHSSEKQEPVFIPKLDLQGAIEDDVTPDVRVPRLDLSEIVPDDDVTRSMTPPRSIPMKPRRRRKKGFRSSPPRVSSSLMFKPSINPCLVSQSSLVLAVNRSILALETILKSFLFICTLHKSTLGVFCFLWLNYHS